MSTVNISLLDITGQGVACPVVFTPQNMPEIVGSSLVLGGQKTVMTDSTGAGSIVLEPGRYVVAPNGIASHPPLMISVPNDSNAYALTALIGQGAALVAPPAPPTVLADITDGTQWQLYVEDGDLKLKSL